MHLQMLKNTSSCDLDLGQLHTLAISKGCRIVVNDVLDKGDCNYILQGSQSVSPLSGTLSPDCYTIAIRGEV